MIDEIAIADIEELLPHLTEDERKELLDTLQSDADVHVWRPLPGPQSMAYHSEADVLGYGGAAGGGKTDLMLGKAINKHKISYILRREATQMRGIYNRMTEIMGGKDGFNGADKVWRLPPDRMIQFGSTPHLGDEMNYQGQARDFLGLDETANFLRAQVVFLQGWVRTTDPNQLTQTLHTFNPPTNAEGRWVVDYYAPWLDDKHPIPAMPGELRWFAVIEGEDVEVVDGSPFKHGSELILPHSRTFIPSRIADNPFLVRTNYMSTLQALPEPLRTQMLYGDFRAGMTDDPWQVIPTKWIDDAMARWKKREPKPEFCSQGVDVARGGDDSTTIANLAADWWFDELKEYPGKETPDGPTTAALCITNNSSLAPIHIDVIGVGASPYDFLHNAGLQVIGVNVSEGSVGSDRSGRLTFTNLRSELWWKFREILDPANNLYPALPPDRNLRTELAAPKWKLNGSTIYVESREEIVKRIGRSPDRATACILAAVRTPKMQPGRTRAHAEARRSYDPLSRRDYNPFK